MKKTRIFALVIALVLLSGVFVACNSELRGEIKIRVRDNAGFYREYTIDLAEAKLTKQSSLADAMRFLAEKDETFTFEQGECEKGAQLSRICTIRATESMYVAVSTTIEKDRGSVAMGMATNGKTYYFSNKGIEGMSIENDAEFSFLLRELNPPVRTGG